MDALVGCRCGGNTYRWDDGGDARRVASHEGNMRGEQSRMDDLISRQAAIEYIKMQRWRGFDGMTIEQAIIKMIEEVPSAQPEIIRCKDCKHNPKYELFECPLSHLSEAQRPETAWCWKAERRTDD